jgi:hypothetical protein
VTQVESKGEYIDLDKVFQFMDVCLPEGLKGSRSVFGRSGEA